MDQDENYMGVPSNRRLNSEEENKKDESIKIKSIKLIENEKEESEEEDDDNILDEEKELLNNYIKYQNIIVEKKEEEDKETVNQKIKQFFNEPIVKRIIHNTSGILGFTSFIMYIVTTYLSSVNFEWIETVDYVFCSFFSIELLINLFLSQHKFSFFLNLDNISDLFIAIFPFFSFIKNMYVKKVIECSKGLLIFKTTKAVIQNFRVSENDLARLLIGTILNFINLIIFLACVYRVIEIDTINYYIMNPNFKYKKLTLQTKFHDFLYFIITTTATIGYGDIYPLTEFGRILIIILICIMIILVPTKIKDLMTILKNSSVYSRDIYKANIEIPHIVICGHITVETLKNFCNELFHVDHGQGDKNVVILDPSMPSQDLLLFLHTGKYEINIKYLQGNPITGKDLERTDIKNAKVIAIMTDKFSEEPHSMDHRNILLSLAIKKYFLQNKMYDSTLFIQLIKPENKIHYQNGLQSLSYNGKMGNDQVIIVEEIKMNLLSKSCLIPGIIPMITNLVKSSGSCDETEFAWLNEYLDGTGNEIYRAELNEQFKNNSFCQISKKIFEEYDAIAFALEIDINGKTIISLNPGEFFIEKSREDRDDVKFYIYVICSDKEIADQIEDAHQLNDDEESELSDQEKEGEKNVYELNHHKNIQTKLHDYLKMYISDIQELDDNDFLNEPCEEEDDYYIIKNFVNNNVDVKKDSIRNSEIYKNHIIVCGTHPSLYYYILPLRARYLGKENLKYLVLLTNDIPKDLWDSISRFENIILVNGSPLNVEDLLRANIEYADKAVILGNNSNKDILYDNQMIDGETIFIYKAIKKVNPNIQIMTELVYDSNIEFLLPDEELEKFNSGNISYENTSVFSAGEVYIGSIIDTLTCQAYYNKHIVTIIHQLLTGGKNSSNHTLSYISENIGLKSSNLWHMPIPTKFINKTFLELYTEFCDKNIIPLGLYRLPGARDNDHPYIYTKPNSETILTHRDKIFVLAINPVKNYKFDKDDEEDDIEKENNLIVNDKLGDKFEEKDKDFEYYDSVVEDGFGQKKFTPLKFVEDMLTEMEKNVSNMRQLMNTTKKNIHESICNGIKQEITSILH